MAVGLAQETPFFLEVESLGRTRRTVRTVLESRRNMATNPSFESGLDGVALGSSAEPSRATEGYVGGYSLRITDTAGSSRFAGVDLDCPLGTGYVRASVAVKPVAGARFAAMRLAYRTDAGLTYLPLTPAVELADGWQTLQTEGAVPTDSYKLRFILYGQDTAESTSTEGYEFLHDAYMISVGATEEDITGGTYFDGDTPSAGGWEYRWEGIQHQSASVAERVEYAEVWGDTSEGAPRTRLTVYNVPDNSVLELRWHSAGQSGPVQGYRNWRVSGFGIAHDWAVPLNREVTYTLMVDGESESTAALTVFSDVAWIQDPLHPDGALPVHSTQIVKGHLLLDSKAISNATYSNNGNGAQVMGSRYPRFNAGLRSAASDVSATMWSDDEPTEAAFRRMVLEAPVLLLRPLPRHRLLPPLAYIAGDVTEDQITVRLGADLTHWTLAGNLVQAVLQAAQSGFITYEQVQELLGGYTYGEVQAAAKSTVYLDWQKNPLIFSNL